MNIADGFDLVMEAAQRGARPDPELEVDKWAEEFMVLPKDAATPGPYRVERTPPARRIMQVLSPRHPCSRVVIKGASQMLKTQIALNFIGASAHRAPANMLVLEPTDSLAKRLSARIAKTVRDVPVLQTVFAPTRSRDNRNTVFAKDIVGGTVYIATAGSAANLAEIPARYVVVDEVDSLEASVDKEGDPVDLAEARMTTFQRNRKGLIVSSPKKPPGASKIDALYEMGTQEVYLVPCPHASCGHHHELRIENFQYERDPDTGFMSRAWFTCPSCGADIDERFKKTMLRDAELGGTAHWHARSLGDGETVSFHVSAFYAQPGSITWLALARQYARAKEQLELGNPEPMKVFYNTRLALTWENTLERTTAQELQARAIDQAVPPRVIPDRALVVTITVDTQPNRLEVQTEAWGPDLEHWVIDYKVFMGSPTEPIGGQNSVWARLDAYRREPFVHASGVLIPASAYGIDSGGANTQDVYNYGAQRVHVGCLVLKGSSRPNRPIISSTPTKVDIEHDGSKLEDGVLLWSLGTDVAKDHLFNRLKLQHGAGAMHFHDKLQLDYFEGLLAERPMLKRIPGGGFKRVYEKVSAGARNEPLDLSVYNLALAHHLGLHRWSTHDWQRLRERLVPKQLTPDLFAEQPAPPPPPAGAVTEPEALAAEPVHTSAPPPLAPTPSGRRILSRGIR